MNTVITQDMATAQGSTIDKIAAEIQRLEPLKKDILAPTRSLLAFTQADPRDVAFTIGDFDDEYTGTKTFHSQLAEKLKIPFAYYSRSFSNSPLFLSNTLNFWIERERDTSKRIVRTIGGVARAFLSDSYRTIDHPVIFQAAIDAFANCGLTEFARCALHDDRMVLTAVNPTEIPVVAGKSSIGDVVNFGVTVKNSETGEGAVQVGLWARVKSCANGMSYHRRLETYRKHHVGRRLEGSSGGVVLSAETLAADSKAIALAVRDAVATYADPGFVRNAVETMQRAMRNELDRESRVANIPAVLVDRYTLTNAEADTALDHFARGGDMSQWGLVQAITRLGHDATSFDRRLELEEAGVAAVEDDWNAILKKLREDPATV